MKALLPTPIIVIALLYLGVAPVVAQNDAWFPDLVTGMIADCITDPTTNPHYSEPPDVNGTRACDDYDPDVLERPTIQQPEDDTENYQAWVDVDTVWFGMDETWLYVGIGVRGLKDGTTMDAKPHFEVDGDADGRGDFLVIHEGGKTPDDFTGSFTFSKADEKLSVYSDGSAGNDRVGGADPTAGEGDLDIDGYETEEWKSGQDPSDNCNVRVEARPGSWWRFDFACRKTLLGDPPAGFRIRATINRGSTDNGNFYLNDEFSASQYGSPYEDNPNFNSGNTYEIDNIPWTNVVQLPVELSSFDAAKSDDEIVLTWNTVSEEDNAGFEVQHRVGSSPFEAVGFVKGAGTTQVPTSYRYSFFTDESGVHLFRLKQTDFDGTFEYSPVVEVAIDLPERFRLEAAYPNPFNPSTTIRFAVAKTEPVSMRLYDVLGQEVRVLFDGVVAADEMHIVEINAEGLPSAEYLVRLEGESFVGTRLITLLK